MQSFEPGDVVRVPFPYTDRATRQWRPASAENRPWPDDIPFGETYPEANLPAPSIVRPCKLATIEGGDAEKIGRVNAEMMEEVVAFLRRAMLGG